MTSIYDNINGFYNIYLDDKLVLTQKNAMTKSGKLSALRCLTGYTQRFAGTMAFGVSSDANIFSGQFITNKYLGFEVSRSSINSWNIDIADAYAKIIFSSDVFESGTDNAYTINELGLYKTQTVKEQSDLSPKNSTFLLTKFLTSEKYTFTTSGELVTDVTSSAKNITYAANVNKFLMGSDSIFIDRNCKINAAKSISVFSDGQEPSSSDVLAIGFYKHAVNSSSINVTLISTTLDSSTASYQYNFTSTASGYQVKTITASSYSASGGTSNFKWDNITAIQVETKLTNQGSPASDHIILDGIRINDAPEIDDLDTGLLSRAVITPIRKEKDQKLTIEYGILIGFNEGV